MWPLRAFPGDDGLFWLGWDLLPGAHGNAEEDEDWEDEEEEEWDEEWEEDEEEWEDEEEDWEDEEEV